MNLLKLICKELGVEVGKEWEANDGYTYTIEGKFLYRKASNSNDWGIVEKECYWKLLVGELKPVWKPKIGEKYYIPYRLRERSYIWDYWENSIIDLWRLDNKLVFKTKEEAIRAANKMLEALKKEG